MGTTASGLPYPEPTDPVSGGAAAIKSLATALDLYPRGQLAIGRLASQVDAAASAITVCTTSVTLPSARRMRVYANLQAQQISVATPATVATIIGGGVNGTRFLVGAVALNDTIIVNGFADFSAVAGTFTASFTVQSNAGALRCAAFATFLTIHDLGKQF